MQAEAGADTRITSPLGLLIARATNDPSYFTAPPPPAATPAGTGPGDDDIGYPPEIDAEVADLEADPSRAGELAALDADVVDFLASTLRPAMVERLWGTEDGRRSQRRAYLGATRTPA